MSKRDDARLSASLSVSEKRDKSSIAAATDAIGPLQDDG